MCKCIRSTHTLSWYTRIINSQSTECKTRCVCWWGGGGGGLTPHGWLLCVFHDTRVDDIYFGWRRRAGIRRASDEEPPYSDKLDNLLCKLHTIYTTTLRLGYTLLHVCDASRVCLIPFCVLFYPCTHINRSQFTLYACSVHTLLA